MTLPVATYRLQMRDGMTFEKAAGLVDYFSRLGISHLYCSPVFTAVAGSTHGYDLTDCNSIDPTIGGRVGLEHLSDALHRAGLGLIVDIVPNHMAASLENHWWRSVVEWGMQSPYAGHFDIDRSERLTLPMLGRCFEECLQHREIGLKLEAGQGCVGLSYFDTTVPLHPASYEEVLGGFGSHLAEAIARRAAEASPDGGEVFHDEVKQIIAASDAAAFEAELVDKSRDGDFLAWVHDEQPYRLTFWKDARRHLSYRRFFEVTGLVGLRVEDKAVFEDAHRLVLDLVGSGTIDGLRIDHVDGLADPTAYLRRLREAVGPQVPIVVEKILAEDEQLPSEWPIEGTTGYEFITSIAQLLTDEEGLRALGDAYAEFAGSHDLEAARLAAKRQIVTENFEGELSRLVELAATTLRDAGECAPVDVIEASLVRMIVAFPVYRTYGDGAGLPEDGLCLVERVAVSAKRGASASETALIDRLAALLRGDAPFRDVPAAAEFRTRFQQLTGPVMAKAVEDTLFYRYNRLIALNEVGGDPEIAGDGLDRFHARMSDRVRSQPFGLSATATHDTKRGEDARARLYALSEYPKAWGDAVRRWQAVNTATKVPPPDAETEWLIYQALAGVWPEEFSGDDEAGLRRLRERFLPYLEKALREAKRHTSWTEPDSLYEKTALEFANRLLGGQDGVFLEVFTATLVPIVAAGHVNSLTQTLIKLSAPGVPDIYQGSEGRDISLVDPDNRRMPDFDALDERLASREKMTFSKPYDTKQQLIARVLGVRRRHPDLFSIGQYVPAAAFGENAGSVVAFARLYEKQMAMAVGSRLPSSLLNGRGGYDPEAWGDTIVMLPEELRDVALTNIVNDTTFGSAEYLSLSDLMPELPVALLVRADGQEPPMAADKRFTLQEWSRASAPHEVRREKQEKTMDTDRKRQVERRAYELWEEEGRPAGRQHAHWDQAEREFAESQSADPGARYPSQQEMQPMPTEPSAKKKRAPAKPRIKK